MVSRGTSVDSPSAQGRRDEEVEMEEAKDEDEREKEWTKIANGKFFFHMFIGSRANGRQIEGGVQHVGRWVSARAGEQLASWQKLIEG